MKNILKIIPKILIVMLFLMPVYSFAQVKTDKDFEDGKTLVPCGNDRKPIVDSSFGGKEGGEAANPCEMDHFIIMVEKALQFILVSIAMPIAAIAFAFAGFLLLTSGGDTGKRKKAKDIFVNVAYGLFFIAGAWLIVSVILSTLGYTGLNLFSK